MTQPNLTPTESYDPMAGTLAARTRMQCAARGCDGCMLCAPDQYARAVEAPTSGLEKINTDAADPWARGGAESSMITPPRRANAGSMVVSEPGVNVTILALDLGTKLGWAIQSRDGRIAHGTEVFTPRASWAAGQRWLRARAFLAELITSRQVHVIAYEDVKRHMGTDAAHAYGAFLCLVEMLADSHRIRLMPVGVKTIKKFWTGNGNADKDAMTAQAKGRGFRPASDNDADALAILHWAVAQERAA